MKKLFFIGLLAATSLWQTGLCCSEIPADNTNGSTGMQTLCKSIAQENINAGYWTVDGNTKDDFCVLWAYNDSPYRLFFQLHIRDYNSYEWRYHTFIMEPYQGAIKDQYGQYVGERIAVFPVSIEIDDNREETGYSKM